MTEEAESLLASRRREKEVADEVAARQSSRRRKRLFLAACGALSGAALAVATVEMSRRSEEVKSSLLYWNGYEPMWNVTCGIYDDDAVYGAASCSEPDVEWFCDEDCAEGSACYEVCGSACDYSASLDYSWGAYCVWEAWASLPDLCAGTFEPSSPDEQRRRLSVNGITCAWHAYCEACDGGKNEYCQAVYHYYFNATQDYIYTGNEQAAEALEEPILATWCEKFDLPKKEANIHDCGDDERRPWDATCEQWNSSITTTTSNDDARTKLVEVVVETGLYSPYVYQSYSLWRYLLNGDIGAAIPGLEGSQIEVTSYTVKTLEALSKMFEGNAVPAGSIVFVDVVGNVDQENTLEEELPEVSDDVRARGCVDEPWSKSVEVCTTKIDAKCTYLHTDAVLLRSGVIRKLLSYTEPLVLVLAGDIGCRLRLPETHHRIILPNDGGLSQVRDQHAADVWFWPQGLEDYASQSSADVLASAVARAAASSEYDRPYLATLSMTYYFRKPSRIRLQEWLENHGEELTALGTVSLESERSTGANVSHHWSLGSPYPGTLQALNSSIFTICPAGDIWSSGRVLEAMLLGSIPVVDATFETDDGASAKGCYDPAVFYRDGDARVFPHVAPVVLVKNWADLPSALANAKKFSPSEVVDYVANLMTYARNAVLDFSFGEWRHTQKTTCRDINLAPEDKAFQVSEATSYYGDDEWFDKYVDTPSQVVGIVTAVAVVCVLFGAQLSSDDELEEQQQQQARFAGVSDPGATSLAKTLYARLESVAESSGVIFGHQSDAIYGQHFFDRNGERGLSDVKEATGSVPVLTGYNVDDLYDGKIDPANITKRSWDEYGGFAQLMWSAPNPTTVADSTSKSADRSCSGNPAKELVVDGSRPNKAWNMLLDKVAKHIKALERPVVFRLFHEMTGWWFWWSRACSTDDDFKAAWRYTVEYLRARGANNVLFAYCPSKPSDDGMLEAAKHRYPGDAYVDLIGFDRYSASDGFKDDLAGDCEAIIAWARERGKIPILGETGISEGLQFVNPEHHDFWLQDVKPLLDHECSALAYVLTWANFSPFKPPTPASSTSPPTIKTHSSSPTRIPGLIT
ncbi:hypothetical protein CTAYLR_004508 [Chrysophaeum taylorii]|uniref:GH26 domain-containing protein n=1 Tax=Chrysophaeum taylorii TaxID=2483200 RepID=A0AAD7UCC3_9STRA|nr:hypothetical protein CTAYLR_004508 [Chrysophaeum taylorii]